MNKDWALGIYRCIMLLITLLAMAAVAAFAGGEHNLGAEDMVLHGGQSGEVPFPHLQHQQALEADCQACHALFAQEQGVIERLKEQGILKNKQVMNKLCIGCHRQRARGGLSTGPQACRECHIKKG